MEFAKENGLEVVLSGAECFTETAIPYIAESIAKYGMWEHVVIPIAVDSSIVELWEEWFSGCKTNLVVAYKNQSAVDSAIDNLNNMVEDGSAPSGTICISPSDWTDEEIMNNFAKMKGGVSLELSTIDDVDVARKWMPHCVRIWTDTLTQGDVYG